MAWTESKSDDRVSENDFKSAEINVQELSREMDFENLGVKDVRRGDGIHSYVDITNFNKVIADAKSDSEKLKKVIQAASVLRKIQADILDKQEVAGLQMQAARLHAFCYKPYDDEAERAKKSVIAAICMNSYVQDVFNDEFSSIKDFQCAIGMASGKTLIANIGAVGNRELISLGTAANMGAKILGKGHTIRITKSIHKKLPKDLAALFVALETQSYSEDVYEATDVTWSAYPDLAKTYEVKFDVERWRDKTKAYRGELPLKDIELSDATTLIDVDNLTETNSKKIESLVLFADIDGFTSYVQSAEKDDDVADLVRQFHMIRAELHAVVTRDYNGVVLQHRGDCLIAILHLPYGDDKAAKRAEAATNIALGLQSSMEHVLNKYLGDKTGIHLAVGIDEGTCLVSRFGKKGQREVVCLGTAVDSAENLQRKSEGEQIRIAKSVYELLPESELKNQFSYSSGSYLMKSMTFPRLKEIEVQKAAQRGQLKVNASSGLFVVGKTSEPPKPHMEVQPWLSK